VTEILHVFLGSSPFQLLNAFEARATYSGPDIETIFVVVQPRGFEEARQMHSVLDRFGAPEVIWIDEQDPVGPVGERVRRQTGASRENSQVFLGTNQSPWRRRLVRELSVHPPVFFDDGNSTLLMARRRHNRLWRLTSEDREHLHQTGRIRGRLATPGLVNDVLHPQAREFLGVEFFSIYRVRGTAHDTWRPNPLSLLRGLRRRSAETRAPVIVGSAFVEARMLSERAYDELIAAARAAMSTRPRYLAHRGESDDRLERLSSRLDLEIVRPASGIELTLLDAAIVPDPLHAVLSTAVDSLGLIFPETSIKTFPPDPDQVDASWFRGATQRKVALMVELQEEARAAVSPRSGEAPLAEDA
jgi:hypothetical protein